MKENEVTAFVKEKTDAIKNAYKDALDILDALILVIEKSIDEEREMIIRTVLHCIS